MIPVWCDRWRYVCIFPVMLIACPPCFCFLHVRIYRTRVFLYCFVFPLERQSNVLVSCLTFTHKVNYRQINLNLRAILVEFFYCSLPESHSEALGCKAKTHLVCACHRIQLQLGRVWLGHWFLRLLWSPGGTQRDPLEWNPRELQSSEQQVYFSLQKEIYNESQWKQREAGHHSKAFVRFLLYIGNRDETKIFAKFLVCGLFQALRSEDMRYWAHNSTIPKQAKHK